MIFEFGQRWKSGGVPTEGGGANVITEAAQSSGGMGGGSLSELTHSHEVASNEGGSGQTPEEQSSAPEQQPESQMPSQ